MRVLSFYKPATPMDGPPSVEHMMKMGAFADEMTRKGHLIAAGGLMAGTWSATLTNGKMTTAQNAQSLIPEGFHGFGIIQANTDAEMSEVIRRFLEVAGDGECRLHPLMEGPPQPE